MELMVLSWLVLQATDSAFQLGLVLVFNNVPRPVFSLFTGFIADRFSRHLMLIIGQSVNGLAAVTLLVLIITGGVEPWHVFLIAFIQGMTRTLEDPSRRTAILDIVGDLSLIGLRMQPGGSGLSGGSRARRRRGAGRNIARANTSHTRSVA